MGALQVILFVSLLLTVLCQASAYVEFGHQAHKAYAHKYSRKHRATKDGALRFEPQPFNKKLELNSAGKIHCKVAGGGNPSIQWFMNSNDPLPEGVISSNGTLLVAAANHRLAGQYTCRAKEGEQVIEAVITLDVVVSPRVLEPYLDQQMHVSAGSTVWLHCKAVGEPTPTTHWDRNATILHPQKDVDVEDGANAVNARILLLLNGTLLIKNATKDDTDHYGCTAGSAAGLARNELTLIVHPEGEPLPAESTGVGGKAVIVSISVAGAYMILVVALVLYCRRRKTANRGDKLEIEMAEGREKLVEDAVEEEKRVGNGNHVANGRLLPHDKDSGADNSEVSGVSRASKKSGQYEHLAVPRTLLSELITLGRGEFGDVLVAKMDMSQVKQLRHKEEGDSEVKVRTVLVKALTTKDETQLAEFRRQLDMFGRVRHANVVRLVGLCNDASPHYMLLEHTDWGDLKTFLIATRTSEESAEYQSRVGNAHPVAVCERALPPLAPQHRVLLATHLAAAAGSLAAKRITHRDIAARNCVITPQLHLKLSLPALTRGPHSHEYYKLHDQVIPLRWLPSEAVLEGEYSMKSDVYMFAATVWEIYTKAELPFVKLNDNSVMERLKSGTLEWTTNKMPEPLADLMDRCWSKSPSDRPSFADICDQMAAILRDVTADNPPDSQVTVAQDTDNHTDLLQQG